MQTTNRSNTMRYKGLKGWMATAAMLALFSIISLAWASTAGAAGCVSSLSKTSGSYTYEAQEAEIVVYAATGCAWKPVLSASWLSDCAK